MGSCTALECSFVRVTLSSKVPENIEFKRSLVNFNCKLICKTFWDLFHPVLCQLPENCHRKWPRQ